MDIIESGDILAAVAGVLGGMFAAKSASGQKLGTVETIIATTVKAMPWGVGYNDERLWVPLRAKLSQDDITEFRRILAVMTPEERGVFRLITVGAPPGAPVIKKMETGKTEKGKPITEDKIIPVDFTDEDLRVKFLRQLAELSRKLGPDEVVKDLRGEQLLMRDPSSRAIAAWFKQVTAWVRKNILQVFFDEEWEKHNLSEVTLEMLWEKVDHLVGNLPVAERMTKRIIVAAVLSVIVAVASVAVLIAAAYLSH